MRRFTILTVAVVCLLAVSCGSRSPRQLILGTWETNDGGETIRLEFEKDGSVRGSRGIFTLTGRYSWPDENTVEIHLDNPFAKIAPEKLGKLAESVLKFRYTISAIDREQMTATDANGKQLSFKRVK
ncbi:MAG: hypothetical protein NZM31_11795 [Gemmatales bacterium]|nr:hypothetical protein [Gemmatales bacterium]MDW8387677.1 hypothetical protein [Gemmatales bacterium]